MGLTEYRLLGYKAIMAHYVLKATKDYRQTRITLPILFLREMGWEEIKYFVLQKEGRVKAKIEPLDLKDNNK